MRGRRRSPELCRHARYAVASSAMLRIAETPPSPSFALLSRPSGQARGQAVSPHGEERWPRHCEERSDEAIQNALPHMPSHPGLLRFARNDELNRSRAALFVRAPSFAARHSKSLSAPRSLSDQSGCGAPEGSRSGTASTLNSETARKKKGSGAPASARQA